MVSDGRVEVGEIRICEKGVSQWLTITFHQAKKWIAGYMYISPTYYEDILASYVLPAMPNPK